MSTTWLSGYGDLKGYLHDQADATPISERRSAGTPIASPTASSRWTERPISLPINNGPNSLHGGTKGFDTKVWAASKIETPNTVGVELTSVLAERRRWVIPGDLAVTVRYTLDNDNDLRIHYSAVSDQPTVINLTQPHLFQPRRRRQRHRARPGRDDQRQQDHGHERHGDSDRQDDGCGRRPARLHHADRDRRHTFTPTTSSSNTRSQKRAATTSTTSSTIPATSTLWRRA